MNRFWSYKLNLVCRESNKYSKSFQFSQQFQSSQSGLSRSMPRSDSRLSNTLSRRAIQSHAVSAKASCRAFNRSKVRRCMPLGLSPSGFAMPGFQPSRRRMPSAPRIDPPVEITLPRFISYTDGSVNCNSPPTRNIYNLISCQKAAFVALTNRAV